MDASDLPIWARTRATREGRRPTRWHPSYVPATYAGTTILDPRSRLVVNRFTGGWNLATRDAVKAAGGIDRWFAQQLSPGSVPDGFYTGSADWWYALRVPPHDAGNWNSF